MDTRYRLLMMVCGLCLGMSSFAQNDMYKVYVINKNSIDCTCNNILLITKQKLKKLLKQ